MYSKRVKKLSKKNRKSRKSGKSRKVQKGGKVTDYTKILHSEDLEVLDNDPLVASRMKNFREAYLGLFDELNNLLKNVNSSNYEIGNPFTAEEKELIKKMYFCFYYLDLKYSLINSDAILSVLHSIPNDDENKNKKELILEILYTVELFKRILTSVPDTIKNIASTFWSIVSDYDKNYKDMENNILIDIIGELYNPKPDTDIFNHIEKSINTIEKIKKTYTYSGDSNKTYCDKLFKMLLNLLNYLYLEKSRYEFKKGTLKNTHIINKKCSDIFHSLYLIDKYIDRVNTYKRDESLIESTVKINSHLKKSRISKILGLFKKIEEPINNEPHIPLHMISTNLIIKEFKKLYDTLENKKFIDDIDTLLYESPYNDMKYSDYTVNIQPSEKSPTLNFNHIKKILELLEKYINRILFIFDVDNTMTPEDAYRSLLSNASLFENILVNFANRSENIGTLNTTGFMHKEDLNKTIEEISSSKIGNTNNNRNSSFNIV